MPRLDFKRKQPEQCLVVPSNGGMCPERVCPSSITIDEHICKRDHDHAGNHSCECGHEWYATTFGSLVP